MNASKGIQIYGERALAAMATEYTQLDYLNVLQPIDSSTLTLAQKAAALNVIDLIKHKRCGKFKGRTVVEDGRKQRSEFTKAETTSPAVTLESVITTLVIDAMESRDVAITDVAGAFLKAEMPDFVVVTLHGSSLNSILRANRAKYEPFVTIENGKRILYVRLAKAMYGTLKAALLWYQLLAETLTKEGFHINPYDPCVANKMINGSQFTICWYVDDLKLSHTNSKEVTNMIERLEQYFGEMNVTRGSEHSYLGIDIEIKDKQVTMRMTKYMQECIDSFGEAINTTATSPGNSTLMLVNEESEELEDIKRKEKFHHVVAKLLHLCKRVRLDLQVAVGFLCTRVQNPTVQDWVKLRRVLQYIKGTLDLPRIVSMESLHEMNIYIDASHGAHMDKRGQTGGCIQMGTGVLHSRSSKQHLNTLSSCETELVGSSEYLPYGVWLMYFLESQGYKIEKKYLHQDNQTTIKIMKNGRRSCGKKSRHVQQRFFWISDRLKNHGIEVKFCPTSLMLAVFFTKPLQGSLFRDMRDVVHVTMGYDVLVKKYDRSVLLEKDAIEKEEKEKEYTYESEENNDNTDEDDNKLPNLPVAVRKERVEKPNNNNKNVSFSEDIKSTTFDKSRKYEESDEKHIKYTYADVARM